MHVLALNADAGIPLLGTKGASIHFRATVEAMARRGHDVTVVAAAVDPKRGPAVSREDVPARVIGPFRGGGSLPGLAVNDALVEAVSGVHAGNPVDLVYERRSLWSIAGLRTSEVHSLPYIVEVNAPLVEEAARWRDLDLREIAAFLERSVLTAADGVVVVSRALADWARALGVPGDRLKVLPNGCDVRRFRPASLREDRPFTVTFVGSLKPWHGLDVLAEAFTRLHAERPDSRLIVVGDGPGAEALAADLDRRLPSDAFRLTGALSPAEVADRLAASDCAVAPYPALQDFYFSPLKVVEYCAAGLPVVASRVGQLAEDFGDGECAMLVEPGDAEEMAVALRRLHDDETLRRRLGRAARAFAETRSWDAVTAHLFDWLSERGLVPADVSAEAVR